MEIELWEDLVSEFRERTPASREQYAETKRHVPAGSGAGISTLA